MEYRIIARKGKYRIQHRTSTGCWWRRKNSEWETVGGEFPKEWVSYNKVTTEMYRLRAEEEYGDTWRVLKTKDLSHAVW